MRLTEHAIERADDRLGWTPEMCEKMAARAISAGIGNLQVSGGIRRYLDLLCHKGSKGTFVRVYAEHVFVFCDKSRLITVFKLPGKYKSAAARAIKQKRES